MRNHTWPILLILGTVVFLPDSAFASLASVLGPNGNGTSDIFSVGFTPGAGFSGVADDDFFSSFTPSSFGGFSYDPNTGVASYLVPSGGATIVITQAFTPGSGFSGSFVTDAFSSAAPSVFGGFSYTDGLASWLSPDGSGGTIVATQAFTPGSGFSGSVTTDAFSGTAPSNFGGFSYDPNTGLASYLGYRAGGGTNVYTQAFTPGSGFSSTGFGDLLDSVGPPSTYGGFSHLSLDPIGGSMPEPSTIAIWSLMCLVGGVVQWRRRRKVA